ncbi:hypothetical protein J3R83DRAFT_14021 [Lanmaoa asiatica]|nr:hypothetical protein J3R83DRAFT_14021 [Lanmaoa asiatica]
MPATRARAAKPPASTLKATSVKSGNTAPAPVDPFPFAQYASGLGVHLLLVGFVALYLPQTTRLFTPLAARKTDRPQSEFVERVDRRPIFDAELDIRWAHSLGSVRLMDAAAFTLCTASATYAVVVMFGAPLTTYQWSHILQTALLAFVIAILTAFTPTFVLGFPSSNSDTPSMNNRSTWTRLFAELSTNECDRTCDGLPSSWDIHR